MVTEQVHSPLSKSIWVKGEHEFTWVIQERHDRLLWQLRRRICDNFASVKVSKKCSWKSVQQSYSNRFGGLLQWCNQICRLSCICNAHRQVSCKGGTQDDGILNWDHLQVCSSCVCINQYLKGSNHTPYSCLPHNGLLLRKVRIPSFHLRIHSLWQVWGTFSLPTLFIFFTNSS